MLTRSVAEGFGRTLLAELLKLTKGIQILQECLAKGFVTIIVRRMLKNGVVACQGVGQRALVFKRLRAAHV